MKMRRPVSMTVGLAAVAGLALGRAGGVPAVSAATVQRVALPDPVPSWTQGVTSQGPAGGGVIVPFRLYLAGRAPAAEKAFATAAATPGTSAYGKYLTPGQFTSRFGPSAAQVAAVESWARTQGFKVAGATSDYVSLTGTAPGVSQALDTTIDAYRSTGVTGYAPVKGASLPASIGHDVSTAVGLDYFSFTSGARRGGTIPRRTPAAGQRSAAPYTCSSWWGQHTSSIPTAEGRTSAPDAVCGYTPQQLRSAYGVTADSGKGATIAVVLDGSLKTMRADANRFFAAHHLPGFSTGQFTVNTGTGFTRSCGASGSPDVPEEPLDVETAHTVAPAAKVVYVAASCVQSGDSPEQEQAFLDAETRIVDQHLADVETDSFSTVECLYTPAMAAAWSQIMERGAAEGIGFNFDSGDGGDDQGACQAPVYPVTFPASDPWASAVGGTSMEIGKSGAVTAELGWGDNNAELNQAGTGYQQTPPGYFAEGSTGGRSGLFAEPAWQRGVVPSGLATGGGQQAAGRVTPDVSADASPMTGWLIGYTPPGSPYRTMLEGGTSGSSPAIAALEADAKAPAGHAIGFADPLLYALHASAGIADVKPTASPALVLAPNCQNAPRGPVHRCLVTMGMDASLRVTTGFDDVTGIGAPTRQFVAALAKG